MLKKFILAAAALAAFASPVLAQAPANGGCITDAMNERYRKMHPEILQREAQLEADIQRQLNGMDLSRFAKTTGLANDQEILHVPVVFHLIHNYGQENVSDEQVYFAMREINDIFLKRNADTSDILPMYAGNVPGTRTKYAARTRIQFHLAQRDPQGRPTNGITRTRSYLTTGVLDNAKIGQWAPESYVNIWVVYSFTNPDAAAYATPPASAALVPFYDGVNVSYSVQGQQAPFGNYINYDNTIGHELGHIMNLIHTFGQTNDPNTGCGDDAVDDTPPTNGSDPNGQCGDLADRYDTLCTQTFVSIGKLVPDVSDTFPDRVANRGISFYTRTRVRIRNVTIYPHDTVGAPFTINVRRNGTLVASYSGNVTFGNGIAQVVPVQFLLLADSLYTMSFGTNPNARRDSSSTLTNNQLGVAGALRITNTSTGGLYNYFYNWDLQYGYFKIYTPAQYYVLYDDTCATDSCYALGYQRRVDGGYVVDYSDTVNYQNVMDYSYCSRMFTNGQAVRMRAALRSNLGGRSTLIDSLNQVTTGIRVGNTFPDRADISPVAEFSINNNTQGLNPTEKVYFCTGKTTTFTNRSWRDTVVSATWTFNGGGATSPTSSSLTTVPNTFNQPGPVDVQLVVTGNNTGSDTEYRQQAVYVADANNKISPIGYYQEFNPGGDLDRYPIFNYFNNLHRWELSPTGYFDNTSIRYRSWDPRVANSIDAATGSPQGDYDDFFMPPVDLTSLASGPCYLNFMYAGATRTASVPDMNDIFEIAYSANCGDTWNTFKTMTKGELHNNGTAAYEFAPGGGYASTQWDFAGITVPNAARVSSALFRFRYRPGALRDGSFFGSGNNFYMDRLHFSNAPAGVDVVQMKETGFSLAPNPTQGGATVVMKGSVDGAQLTVTDVTGKMVYRSVNAQKNTSYTSFEIPAQAVGAKGIYFVRVGRGIDAHTEKLVVY